MNLLPERVPHNSYELPIESYKDYLMAAYTIAIAKNNYKGYPRQQERLFLDSVPYNKQGLIAFNNYGSWTAGNIYPTTEEKLNEVLHNIGYPKMCTLDADYRPLHPWWKDMVLNKDIGGVIGKGFYYYWGANYSSDAAVLSFDKLKVPHLLLIKRADSNEWALPGGFISGSESTKAAAVRELQEESGLILTPYDSSANKIYSGPVLDIRTTIHAWTETSLWLFKTNFKDLPQVKGSDDATDAKWFNVNNLPNNLYGSHPVLINMALNYHALEKEGY